MSRVIAVVEGQTEQDFVREILAPWLGTKGVYLSARLVGKPGQKGGVGEYLRARRDLLLLLKQESETTITTMFDFYGMPDSWPGRSNATSAAHSSKASIVEQELKADIVNCLGTSFNSSRFLPYVQMHEFEALLFSEPSIVCHVLRDPQKTSQIDAIRQSFATPEEINDSEMTAPSKRLTRIFTDYQKRIHGLIAATRIGLAQMRSECPHFNEWLTTMENL